MPRIHVRQTLRRLIERCIEERDVVFAVRRVEEQSIELTHDRRQLARRVTRPIARGQTSQRRLHCRHQQRRRHSLARDICYRETELTVIEIDEVVIITADTARRLAKTCHFHRYTFRSARWKQSLLHFGCERKLTSHTFLRDHAFRESRVVDDERELRSDRHKQLAIGDGVLKATASWSKREYSYQLVLLSDLHEQCRLDREQHFMLARTL